MFHILTFRHRKINTPIVIVIMILCTWLISGCHHPDAPILFQSIDARHSGIDFVNSIKEKDSLSVIDFEYLYNGAGVGIGDFNNDGLPDIFFSGNENASKLYLNKGNFKFQDITGISGIDDLGRWGSGVSVVDINGDGWQDIYLSVSGSHEFETRKNLLFVNQGLNDHHIPVFKEVGATVGLDDNSYTTHASFFDYDRDGDLDVYLVISSSEILSPNIITRRINDGSAVHSDRLYRNEGLQSDQLPRFKDVSLQAGITWEGFSLGIGISDLNLDGWPDIYISNDYITNDIAYINNRDGTFTNRISEMLKHQSRSSMGMDIADFNNDCLPDIAVLDMLPTDNYGRKVMQGADNYSAIERAISMGYEDQYVRNVLQMHNGMVPETSGKVSFSDIGQLAGIESTDWSWSLLFADFDNDGYKDIHVANGYPEELTNMDFINFRGMMSRSAFDKKAADEFLYRLLKKLRRVKRKNMLYHNNGDLTFSNINTAAGIGDSTFSYGTAYADFDLDGDLDLIVSNTNDNATLYENISAPKHYLRIRLAGPQNNVNGIGTKIWIESDLGKQFLEQNPFRGYQSTVEDILHFGLGADTLIAQLRVQWPDGKVQELAHVHANQVLELRYGDARFPAKDHEQLNATPPFRKKEVSNAFKHQEQAYLDFAREKLLPHRYSMNGPGLAVGDVNGDGKDDFVIGGAGGQGATLYLYNDDSTYFAREVGSRINENLGMLLFDADGDKDLDLYMVSGGNEHTDPEYFQDHIYQNDGAGNFMEVPEGLPEITASGSCVIAQDYDLDGDLDLFVGGRVKPGFYGQAPVSYLLRNDSQPGKIIFSDVTATLQPDLVNAGMVTGALWTDFNQDGWWDLMIVGEWMPVTFYMNDRGRSFVDVTETTGLSHTRGGGTA